MTIFYSASTGSFFHADVHGPRRMLVPDLRALANLPPVDDDQADDVDLPMVEVDNPRCLIPADAVEISAELHAQILEAQSQGRRIAAGDDGRPVTLNPLPPTAEELRAAITRGVQAVLDGQARALGYDSMAAAVTYAEEPAVPRYQAEGRALRAWRSLVWQAVAAQLETDEMPAAADVMAGLPAFQVRAD